MLNQSNSSLCPKELWLIRSCSVCALQDNSNGRKQKLAQSISRIQQMKKGSSGSPPRCSPTLNQVNPDRRRLRRGETVEVSSPSGSLAVGPRPRERPLGRCHTLDSG
ncbi:ankyrin repeat domain-containing protein 27 isoform X1, partial [Lates japonicus]